MTSFIYCGAELCIALYAKKSFLFYYMRCFIGIQYSDLRMGCFIFLSHGNNTSILYPLPFGHIRSIYTIKSSV